MTLREQITLYLSPDEINRYINNMVTMDKAAYLDTNNRFNGSFIFDTTTEGHAYWYDISQRIEREERYILPQYTMSTFKFI